MGLLNSFLTSWKSQDDPRTGNYSCRIDPSSLPQLILYKDQALEWWVGSWTSQKWSGIPEITSFRGMFNFSFKNNRDETSFMYEISNDPIFPVSMGVVRESGTVELLVWNDREHQWLVIWYASLMERCENCGNWRNCSCIVYTRMRTR
ncbi:hypothetical protein PRUPE_4G031500 [Prunus persica]|uniref:S-locus glycoprotein domain-containing protein n=1 Tax=Prunus persica TaxID=3760 RepID=M5X5U6_PRUPE|nr:hypothetical protein PRUPE_4G031500 [Prunus persica]